MRVRFAPVEGAGRLFAPAFMDYLVLLHDRLGARALALRAKRDEVLRRAHQHAMPAHPPASEATSTRLNDCPWATRASTQRTAAAIAHLSRRATPLILA